ncbi:MAG: hypothetical protein HQL50_13525 [Magnetococcales bacterium]|nr:hypothetical protein [Magnetococcales bacterium]
MAIRRLDKSTKTGAAVPTGKGRAANKAEGAKFASLLDSVAGVKEANPVAAVSGVGAIEEASPHQRREQLGQTDELLDSLEALDRDMRQGRDAEGRLSQDARERLRESRDQALRTLSEHTNVGEERELLHRTTILATAELAKSDRGDY